jgi:hypothetical protein
MPPYAKEVGGEALSLVSYMPLAARARREWITQR